MWLLICYIKYPISPLSLSPPLPLHSLSVSPSLTRFVSLCVSLTPPSLSACLSPLSMSLPFLFPFSLSPFSLSLSLSFSVSPSLTPPSLPPSLSLSHSISLSSLISDDVHYLTRLNLLPRALFILLSVKWLMGNIWHWPGQVTTPHLLPIQTWSFARNYLS